MIIAIGFDSAWRRSPAYFRAMVQNGAAFGHRYVIVTTRPDEGDWAREVRDTVARVAPIVFAGGVDRKAAALAAGFDVDVWIGGEEAER